MDFFKKGSIGFVLFFSLLIMCLPVFVQAVNTTTPEGNPLTPKDNPSCWTQEVCEAGGGRYDSDSFGAKETCGSTSFGYCYPPASNYDLNVSLPIGGSVTTSVTDLGDYIGKIYLFILGTSTSFAVLMLVVGGVQYIIAPEGGEVSKAKERITNSLTGMVLLFCATLILFTINPQLISLEMPSIPKLRTTLLISASTTCEDLIAAGYTIEPASGGKCGDTSAKVLTDASTNDISSQNKTCRWNTCLGNNPLEYCLDFPDPTIDQCLSCNKLSGNEVVLSQEFCAQMKPEDVLSNDRLSKGYECFLTTDPVLGASTSIPRCALAVINCDNISFCDGYNNQSVFSSLTLRLFEVRSGASSSAGLQTICEDDPCGVGAKTGTVCDFSNLNGTDGCIQTTP